MLKTSTRTSRKAWLGGLALLLLSACSDKNNDHSTSPNGMGSPGNTPQRSYTPDQPSPAPTGSAPGSTGGSTGGSTSGSTGGSSGSGSP
jgi:hypothetical protein